MGIELIVWIEQYKMTAIAERINFDTKTVEVRLGEGDLFEFDFDEVELVECRVSNNGSEVVWRGI